MNYTLKNEGLEITIRTFGAELISLKSEEGREYIWERNPEFWNRCAPVLFPVVGRLRDKFTMIDGTKYEMDIHGFLKDQEFSLLSQTKNTIRFINRYSEATLKLFPYKYEVIIAYFLTSKTVKTEYQVKNIGNETMPFNIGGHPAIKCPLYQNDEFNDYTIHFEKPESFSSPTIEANGTLNFDKPAKIFTNLKELKLDRTMFSLDTIVIPSINSHEVVLSNNKHQGIKFSFPGFKTFAIWTRFHQQAPFICLEPWIGYGDRYDADHQFIKKDDLINLEKNGQFIVSYDIELLE
jgi:galactose mutarotase-like enzyme